MGVMECHRKDCDNIMCDGYNNETGYICFECLRELEQKQKLRPAMDVDDIVNFMRTSKNTSHFGSDYIQPMIDLNKFFGLEREEEDNY